MPSASTAVTRWSASASRRPSGTTTPPRTSPSRMYVPDFWAARRFALRLVSRPATFAPFRRGRCTKDLIAAAGSESYLGIVRVRMTRCHLACRPLILPALLSGARSSSAAHRPARSSGPGISQRSSGSGWLMAGAVVVKVRPDSPRLAACVEVQRRLFASGYPCPEPLTGVAPFGDGVATAEAYVPGGALLPSAGRSAWAFAGAFARLVTLAPRPAEVPTLTRPRRGRTGITSGPGCGRIPRTPTSTSTKWPVPPGSMTPGAVPVTGCGPARPKP